ncbi:MAG TPA: glycosyltransferase family 4 protein [Treponema sp.]|nr:glycosyltransferase family 4 protein [Treponema sp.]
MNIALFTDSYLPAKNGVVTVVTQTRKALEAMGHHVIIVTVENTRELRKTRTEDPNIFRVRSIPLGLGTSEFIGLPQKRKIKAFLRKHKIEIIHSHTEFYIAHAAKQVGKSLHLPTIATTHTMWEDFYDYYIPMARLIPVKAIRKIVKRLYKKFYAFINVSSKARDYFKKDFMLPQIPSVVIPNAVDIEAFINTKDTAESLEEMRRNWNIPLDNIVLLFVGRIGEEKRVLKLLDIAINLVNRFDNVTMVFAGNGPSLVHMKKTIKKATLDHRIVFTGFVNWTDVHTYYAMSDIFTTVSLSEMHSMTVLESLFSGLPVVTRSDSSYFDTVLHGENGYLAETDEEVEAFLAELILDGEKRKKFSDRSRKIAQNFTIENHARKIVAFYQTVIDTFPKPIDEKLLQAAVDSQ